MPPSASAARRTPPSSRGRAAVRPGDALAGGARGVDGGDVVAAERLIVEAQLVDLALERVADRQQRVGRDRAEGGEVVVAVVDPVDVAPQEPGVAVEDQRDVVPGAVADRGDAVDLDAGAGPVLDEVGELSGVRAGVHGDTPADALQRIRVVVVADDEALEGVGRARTSRC